MTRKSKEADKEYNRKYYQEHKEKLKEKNHTSSKKWKATHKDEWAAYMREYRKRKKAELDKAKQEC